MCHLPLLIETVFDWALKTSIQTRGTDGKIIPPSERVLVGAGGAVARSRDQLFYMDEGTESDGRIKAISVFKDGILSLFGPKTSKGKRIISANVSASIRGTTTYFTW